MMKANKGKQNIEGWELFLNLTSSSKLSKQIDSFFNFILTEEEKQAISGRCLIVKALLQEEKTQREISYDYNVSISKITRGSNGLKAIDKKLEKHIKNICNIDI